MRRMWPNMGHYLGHRLRNPFRTLCPVFAILQRMTAFGPKRALEETLRRLFELIFRVSIAATQGVANCGKTQKSFVYRRLADVMCDLKRPGEFARS